MFLGQLLALLLLHLPVLHQVSLQSNQDLADSLTSIAFDLLNPPTNVLKALFVIDCIGQNDASRPLVVSLGNIAKPFLPGSIPNLQLHLSLIDVDRLQLKVYPNCRHIAVLKDSVTELGQ